MPAKTVSTARKAPPRKAAGKATRTVRAAPRTRKPAVEARRDQPAPIPRKGRARKAPPKPLVVGRRDSLDPEGSVAAELLKRLRRQEFVFHHAQSTAKFDGSAFMEFFGAEIEAELEREATIFNDRFARWACQCCDAVIPVPRRTEVFHGDYHLVHDDVMGLLVNGERWVPKAETPLEVVQPGRLRNPWTGKTLEGRDLGTTGAY